MLVLKLVVVLSVMLCWSQLAAGLQLVGLDGQLIANHHLSKLVPSGTNRILNVLDCTYDSKCEVVNEVLGTTFQNAEGVSVDVVDNAAVHYTSSDQINPARMSALIEYYVSLSDKLVLLFDAPQIESSLDGHERIFRKLLSLCHSRARKNQRTEIDIVCVGQSTDPSYVEKTIAKRFELLWSELEILKTFKESVSLKVVSLSSSAPNAVKSAFEAASMHNPKELGASELFEQTWNNAVQTASSVISSKEHQQAVAVVEATYMRNLIRSNTILVQWQNRVAAGKMVADFGRRVKDLMISVQKDFQESTAGGAAVKERIERLRSLNVHLVEVVSQLQQAQLSNLMSETEEKCKRELLKLVEKTPDRGGDEGTTDEAGNLRHEDLDGESEKLVRRLLFDFKTRCDSMTNDWLLATVGEAYQSKLAASLVRVVKEFPESGEYRLALHEREMKQVRSTSSGSGSRISSKSKPVRSNSGGGGGGFKEGRLSARIKSVLSSLLGGVSLSLVGMVRPPGHGNFQAVISTASQALWGFPVSYLLGIHNDGESMEVMGDDREYPLIRLQPKINFNIDL